MQNNGWEVHMKTRKMFSNFKIENMINKVLCVELEYTDILATVSDNIHVKNSIKFVSKKCVVTAESFANFD